MIETPDLGDRSYVVSDRDSAIIIDPQRDLDRVQDASPVYPTHGFGSFCSSGAASGGSDSTIAASIFDRAGHPVVHVDDDHDNAEKAGLELAPP